MRSLSGVMKVKDIDSALDRETRRIHTTLGQVSVSDGGTDLLITREVDGEEVTEKFEFDEVTERQVGEFLDVSPVYLRKCPAALKAYNVNYWLQHQDRRESEALFMAGPKGIEQVINPDATIITVPDLAGVISRVFAPEDEIMEFRSESKVFHADIVVQDSHITVPGNGLGDRPNADGTVRRGHDPLDEVGPERRGEFSEYTESALVIPTTPQVFDITHGGVRILSQPNKAAAPTVERYFNRYLCANGLTMPVPDRKITLRGNTLEEVLEEIEEAAEFLLGSMDEQLERYKALAEVEIPGNPLMFIQQIGKEQGIPANLIQKAIDYAGGAGFGRSDSAPVTSYDVLQIFTSLANNNSVKYSTKLKLQRMGGVFIHRGEELTHRCETCERPLV